MGVKDCDPKLTEISPLANPADACRNDGGAVCSWIPGGIAVVPELKTKSDGAVEWIPAR